MERVCGKRTHAFVLMICILLAGRAAFLQGDTGGWYTNRGPNGAKLNTLVIDPSNPSILYVGADGIGGLKSFDSGLNWICMRNLPSGAADFQDLVIHPNDPMILYAATASTGVIKSTDWFISIGKLMKIKSMIFC